MFDRIADLSKKIHKFNPCSFNLICDTPPFHVFVSRLFQVKDVLIKMRSDVHYFMLINDVKKTSRFKHQITCANKFFKLKNKFDFVYRKGFYFQIFFVFEVVIHQRFKNVSRSSWNWIKVDLITLNSIFQTRQILNSFRNNLLREKSRVFLILCLALDNLVVCEFNVEAKEINVENCCQ